MQDQVAQRTARAIDRLPALDGIRIIAATGVVLVHVGGASGYAATRSWGGWFEVMSVGVAIFFVLSGFVVFQPWVRAAAGGAPAPDIARFVVRRFARILPACYVVVAACLIMLAGGATVSAWARHLTFTQIYTWRTFGPSLVQTWTLCVELTFYLVLPALAAFALSRRLSTQPWRPARSAVRIATVTVPITMLWLVGLVTGVLKLYLHHMWLPAYLMWFGAGMLLCTAYVALNEGVAPRAWRILDVVGAHPWICWSLAVAGLALGSTGVAGPRGLEVYTPAQFTTRLFLHLAIAVLVMIPLVFGRPTRLRAVVGSGPVRWLGGSLSYGLYLWHPFVIEEIFRQTGWVPMSGRIVALFVLTMGGALTLAALSHYFVERPVIKIASRFRESSCRDATGSRPVSRPTIAVEPTPSPADTPPCRRYG